MFFGRIGQRSLAKKVRDEAFLQALKNIDTLVVQHGRMSMDASELEGKVRESRKQANASLRQQPEG